MVEGFQSSVIIEPFKIKSVEPIGMLSRGEREQRLREAKLNLFKISSTDVLIDLLTDSGTSAMSAEQWAQIQRGDEAYAGSVSYQEFRARVEEITGFPYVIPTHQGRAAERLLFSVLVERHAARPLKIPNNSHFDTTRANCEALGIEALDFPSPEFLVRDSVFPFKGNMDLQKLEDFLKTHSKEQVPVGFSTITNNSCGGQPVSFQNLKATAQLYRKFKIPFFLDACRFAENVAFIRKNEFPEKSPKEIARMIFDLADGCTFSAKKDALVNIGGFLALRSHEWIEDLTAQLILTEGFPTYGGLAGRDLAAMATGLEEVLKPEYLEYRLAVTKYMGDRLTKMQVPFLKPAGGHAIYLDAREICAHLSWNQYPGQVLALALYLEGGIRSCEIGSVMFGRRPDGSESPHSVELVRLAIPRRVYTQSHMDYVCEVIEFVTRHIKTYGGVKITKEPKRLRHFSAEFSWVK